jgi:hypothetical protein
MLDGVPLWCMFDGVPLCTLAGCAAVLVNACTLVLMLQLQW